MACKVLTATVRYRDKDLEHIHSIKLTCEGKCDGRPGEECRQVYLQSPLLHNETTHFCLCAKSQAATGPPEEVDRPCQVVIVEMNGAILAKCVGKDSCGGDETCELTESEVKKIYLPTTDGGVEPLWAKEYRCECKAP